METRESESTVTTVPGGERPHRWWPRPLVSSLAAIYLGQLVPFVAGPLTECAHCVGNYLKLFPLVPGVILGEWSINYLDKIVPGNQRLRMGPDWIQLGIGLLIVAVLLFCITMITAKVRGKWRWVWLGFLASASAVNALLLGAALRS